MHKTIKLDTWQFVRVMVALEERGKRGALWRHWSSTWRELDAELEALAATDFDAYSELMVRHRLELELPTAVLYAELQAAVQHVTRQMQGKLQQGKDADGRSLAPSQRNDLEFEISELKILVTSLKESLESRGAQQALKAGGALSQDQGQKANSKDKRKADHDKRNSSSPRPKVRRTKPTDGRGNLRAGAQRRQDQRTHARNR